MQATTKTYFRFLAVILAAVSPTVPFWQKQRQQGGNGWQPQQLQQQQPIPQQQQPQPQPQPQPTSSNPTDNPPSRNSSGSSSPGNNVHDANIWKHLKIRYSYVPVPSVSQPFKVLRST